MSVETGGGAVQASEPPADTLAAVERAAKRGEWAEVVRLGEPALRQDPAAGVGLFLHLARAYTEISPGAPTLAWFDALAEQYAPRIAAGQLGWMHHWLGDAARGDSWLRRAWLWRKAPDPQRVEAMLDVMPLFADALSAAPDKHAEASLLEIDLATGKMPSARARLDRLIKAKPSAALLRQRGALQNEVGDGAAAERSFGEALALAPDDVDARRELNSTRRAAELDLALPRVEVSDEPYPLTAMLAPHRTELQSWWFYRKFSTTDLGDAIRTRVFRRDSGERDWVHPVYCAAVAQLSPTARENGRFLFDRVPSAILDAVRAGEGSLLIDHGSEGLFRHRREPQTFLEFMTYLDEAKLPPERVIVLDMNLNSPGVAADLAAQAGVKAPPIYASWFGWTDFSGIFRRMRREAGGVDERLLEAARTVKEGVRRSKHFLCYNHAPRPHRGAVVAYLLHSGLIDRGLVSFKGPDYWREKKGAMDDEQWVANLSRQIGALTKLPDPEGLTRRLLAATPMRVDISFEGTGRKAKQLGYGGHNAWPYLDSYLSIVTESDFGDGRSMVLTEKPLKAFANLHPFVFVGDPGGLAAFRARGYRTFSPWIDESYDEIQDPRARMLAVLTEIDRLLSQPIEKLHEMYCECWPVLLHNYRMLLEGEPKIARGVIEDIRRLATV